MSNEVFALVKKRVVGSPTMKSVLLYMADSASDDGSGIYCSKATMAANLEFKSKRTVQTAILDLVKRGLVRKTGTRSCRNGYTDEYQIVLGSIRQLPFTLEPRGAGNAPVALDVAGAGNAPVQEMHLTGAGNAPHGVQEMHPNHPRTIKEPCSVPAAQNLDIDKFDPNPEAASQQTPENGVCSGAGPVEEKWISDDRAFRQFFDAYPRKAQQSAARDAFDVALGDTSGGDREQLKRWIVSAAKRYAIDEKGNDLKFVLMAKTFLKDARWQDYPKPIQGAGQAPADREAREAHNIRSGIPALCSHIPRDFALMLARKELVTGAELRKVNLATVAELEAIGVAP